MLTQLAVGNPCQKGFRQMGSAACSNSGSGPAMLFTVHPISRRLVAQPVLSALARCRLSQATPSPCGRRGAPLAASGPVADTSGVTAELPAAPTPESIFEGAAAFVGSVAAVQSPGASCHLCFRNAPSAMLHQSLLAIVESSALICAETLC